MNIRDSRKLLEELADSVHDPLELVQRRIEKKKEKIAKLQAQVEDMEQVLAFARIAFDSTKSGQSWDDNDG